MKTEEFWENFNVKTEEFREHSFSGTKEFEFSAMGMPTYEDECDSTSLKQESPKMHEKPVNCLGGIDPALGYI